MRGFLKITGITLFIGIAALASRPSTLLAFPSFSLAPGSPSAGVLPPGSVLDPFIGAPTPGGPQPPPVVAFTNASLGVPAAGNVQDISYGDDQVIFVGFGGGPVVFHFSVAPGTLGGPWLPPAPPYNVFTQGVAGEDSAASDIFTTTVPTMPPPFGALGCGPGGNVQLYDGDGLNLVGPPVPGLGGLVDPAGPPPDDAIDAYEDLGPKSVDYQMALNPPMSGPDGRPDAAIFFTVDPATALLMGVSPADVLVTDPNSPMGWAIYAPAVALGLLPGDDIDALMVADSATMGVGPGSMVPPPRTFSPATPLDFIAFSLAPGSPSLAPGGPVPPVCGPVTKTAGDIWGVSPFLAPGPFALASAESLGLCSVRVGCAVNDNLVAMDVRWAIDADMDGAPDPLEPACGAVIGPSDTDIDGLPDSIEMALSSNPAGICAGFPRPGMTDSDLDGMPDGWEVAYWTPSCLGANASIPDPLSDVDGDGVPNIVELSQSTSPCNPDSDGDGFLDLQSTSHQGPANTVATTDNCPNVANPSQANNDGNFIQLNPPKAFDDKTRVYSDRLGDACDPDNDNDGLLNVDELNLGPGGTSHALCLSATANTNTMKADTDGDGFLDRAECTLGTDPASAASKPAIAACGPAADSDGDGVLDQTEFCKYNTSVASTNTDGDGCGDGREIASINGDLAVNSIDLGQVAIVFGPHPLSSVFADFDMNKDGAVNSLDLLFVALHFGPCP